jgi:polysaccharide pyruvyl transferase WcaK-like protein
MDRVIKRIGLLDHVGTGNLGDDSTLTAVIQNIKTRWPHAQIAAFSINPADTEKRHGIRSYAVRRTTLAGSNPFLIYFDLDGDASSSGKRVNSFTSRMKSRLRKHRLLFRVLQLLKLTVVRAKTFFAELLFLFKSYRILRSFDLLVISGGGQLLDCWGGPWDFPYTIWKWIFLASLARAKRVFLNVGAGPLENPLSIFFITRALRLADYTSFRDWKSQALIQQIGFTARSNVVADCVYSLATLACDTATTGRPGNGVVGISPMAYCHPGVYWKKDRGLYDSFIQKLSAFGSALIGSGHRIVLFTTDIWFDSQTIEDLKNALETEVGLAQSCWITVRHVETTEALLSTMCLMDYVITCRFHGVVFAHLLNKPVLAISPHPKVATLMNDIGLSEYCVNIDSFDSDLLLRRFSRLARNGESIKGHMAETLDGFRRKLASQFDDLFPRGNTGSELRG